MCVAVADGQITEKVKVWPSTQHSEGDIRLQKIIAVILGAVSLVLAWNLYKTLTTSAVLDEQGLTINGRAISWEAMQELRTDQYREKGWVDLVCEVAGRRQEQRIDSYHFERFKEMITAICERKGFVSPLQSGDDNQAGDPPKPV
jgi:hypothetical protein